MIEWQPMATAPIDRKILVHFPSDDKPRTILYIYVAELTKRGKSVANAWAHANLPDASEESNSTY